MLYTHYNKLQYPVSLSVGKHTEKQLVVSIRGSVNFSCQATKTAMLRSLFRRSIATGRNRFGRRGHRQPAAVENAPNFSKEIITLEEYIDIEETGSVDSAFVRRSLVAEGSEGGWSTKVKDLSTDVQSQLSTMLHHPKVRPNTRSTVAGIGGTWCVLIRSVCQPGVCANKECVLTRSV
jgi:hypothetical protein